jgi:hypothetical protein
MTMMRFCALALLGLVAFGCSSKDDNGELNSDPNGGNNPPGTGDPGVVLPGNPLPGGGGSDSPGISDLTPEQVDQLRNSSCAGWSAEAEIVPAVLELVVDVSSSMKDPAPGSNRSKWEATRDALLEAIVGVNGPGLPASTGVGLLFYPNVPNVDSNVSRTPTNLQACVATNQLVPIATLGPQGATHRRSLESAFRDAQLNPSTPTHDAFRYALNSGLLPTKVPGSKYMLLITDGTPTLELGCMNENGNLSGVDPMPIVDEVRAAAQKYAKTFLIGSPGSEANRNWMSQAARIGGTAPAGCSDNGPNYCHMDLTTSPDFADALRKGLEEIAGQIASCTYDMPEPPRGQSIDPARNNVIYTPRGSEDARLVGRTTQADCTEGWQLKDNQVTICPDTCAAIQGDAGATIELMFGCAAVDSPIR